MLHERISKHDDDNDGDHGDEEKSALYQTNMLTSI